MNNCIVFFELSSVGVLIVVCDDAHADVIAVAEGCVVVAAVAAVGKAGAVAAAGDAVVDVDVFLLNGVLNWANAGSNKL